MLSLFFGESSGRQEQESFCQRLTQLHNKTLHLSQANKPLGGVSGKKIYSLAKKVRSSSNTIKASSSLTSNVTRSCHRPKQVLQICCAEKAKASSVRNSWQCSQKLAVFAIPSSVRKSKQCLQKLAVFAIAGSVRKSWQCSQ